MGSDEAAGDAEDLEHTTFIMMQADQTFDSQGPRDVTGGI